MRPTPAPEPRDAPEKPESRSTWLGFRLPFDILVAPERAFKEILVRPGWITAYAVIVFAGWAGIAMITPALEHLKTVLPPPDGFAGRPPTELSEGVRAFVGNLALTEVVSTLFAIGLTSMVLFIVSRLKASTLPFNVYVALAANCLVPTAIGSLLGGVVTAAHPAASFHDFRAFVTALPDNLALFADPAHANEALFLGEFDIFTLWSALLLAYGFAAVTPVKLTTALALAFALTLASSIF